MVLGSVLGGLIASRWGITAPFWFAFVGSALFLALIWRQLVHVAHADEEIVEQDRQPRHRVIRGERPRLPEMSGTAG